MKPSILKKTLTHLRIALKVLVMSGVMIGAMLLYISSIANAAILNPSVEISEEHIRLGHVFSGIEGTQAAAYILGPAPEIGRNVVLNAPTLRKLARTFGLDWQSRNNLEQVVITRAATIIEAERIEDAVKSALREQAIHGEHRFSIDPVRQDLVLPGHYMDTVRVENIALDRNTSRFHATIVAPASGAPVKRMDITGKLEYLVEVPVVNRRIRRNEVIQPGDIKMIELAEYQVSADMVLDEADLIGMTPRRILIEGQAIQAADIVRPHIVKRGDRVTMHYKQGVLNLTTVGKALQNGAEGDNIRVVNLKSNRTVDAFVTAENRVTVSH